MLIFKEDIESRRRQRADCAGMIFFCLRGNFLDFRFLGFRDICLRFCTKIGARQQVAQFGWSAVNQSQFAFRRTRRSVRSREFSSVLEPLLIFDPLQLINCLVDESDINSVFPF